MKLLKYLRSLRGDGTTCNIYICVKNVSSYSYLSSIKFEFIFIGFIFRSDTLNSGGIKVFTKGFEIWRSRGFNIYYIYKKIILIIYE